MMIRKLSKHFMMSERELEKQEMIRLLKTALPSQTKVVLSNLINDKDSTPEIRSFVYRHMRLVLKRKKKTVDVFGDIMSIDKILLLKRTNIWDCREIIISKAMSTSGGVSTKGLAAYLSSNYMDVRDLIQDGDISKTGKRNLSLLLRMAGFKNGVARKRMENCDLNTSHRSWFLPRSLKHTSTQALLDNAEIIMMKALDVDTTEARGERNAIEAQITPVIEDLI